MPTKSAAANNSDDLRPEYDLSKLTGGVRVRIRKVSADGNVTELARMWGRRSFAGGAVMAAIVGVIVGAKWFRSRRRPPDNTPLQPTRGAGATS